ncbi:MAG: hypothetical protein FWC24_00845 [Treponema sp.]|nr:hypothetical protein [Treponema sp.]MCL2269866.1 hypothetical protein [Treponema sp.]
MREYLQIFSFVVIGVTLLWFGFNLFTGQWEKINTYRGLLRKYKKAPPGNTQACPICSSKLTKGDLVKTLAFPSITGGKDRLMHIRGCAYCIGGDLDRYCPVCGTPLNISDILVARIFERPRRRPHVHVTGCNKCRRTGII